MKRNLAWIAMVSLSVAAACGLAVLASATAFVGSDHRSWLTAIRSCSPVPWTSKAGRAADGHDGAGASEPRTIDLGWDGSDAVRVQIPAKVYYQPGPKAQASVSGDAELISHVRMHDGTLDWDNVVDCVSADDLVVRFTGPAVTSWTLNGSGELHLSDIKQDVLRVTTHGSSTIAANGEVHDTSVETAGSGRIELNIRQDTLHVTTHGSGAVVASGEARDVSLHSTGSGSADLGRLVAQQVDARISGSAEADLAPREDADISISGSGIVRLHGAGARIHSHVSGSGEIKQVP
jgi:Putative auto-transporter adhesin, head GIN domain